VLKALELVTIRVCELRDVESDVELLGPVVLKALELVAARVGEPRDAEDEVGSIRSMVLVLVFPNSGKMVL
jgi:hypothetical protein